ncbi:hypothetical protein C8J57DRAFT_1622388 [Mycena rebaudengoi]|nr:hypothetical protein C8J57DRAFT_1622388 [Mycena rebaudengoi]
MVSRPHPRNAGTPLEKQVMGYYWNTSKESEVDPDEAAEAYSSTSDEELERLFDQDFEENSSTDEETYEDVPEISDDDADEEEAWETAAPSDEELEDEDSTGLKIFYTCTFNKNGRKVETRPRRIYEAERTIPGTKAVRKQAFDGVYPPRRPEPVKKSPPILPKSSQPPPPKEKVPEVPATAPLRRSTRNTEPGATPRPPATPVVRPERAATQKHPMAAIPQQRPVNARRVRVAAPEDVEMPDAESSRTPKNGRKEPSTPRVIEPPSLQRKTDRSPKPGGDPPKEATKQEISGRRPPDLKNLVERCWELPLATTFGQLCDASKEFRTAILERIKPKLIKAVMLTRDRRSVVAHVPEYPSPEEDGVLIKICMEIAGHPVVAIMDTGSQLDVIRQGIADRVLKQPTDVTRVIQMNNANGGESTLNGRVDRVHMYCGGMKTQANLYISSNHVPFDLLLGRKWQRQNFVGINERKDGTYLIFKDPCTLEPKYELLVQTEHVTEAEARSFRSFLLLQERTDELQQDSEEWRPQRLSLPSTGNLKESCGREGDGAEEEGDMRLVCQPGPALRTEAPGTPCETAHQGVKGLSLLLLAIQWRAPTRIPRSGDVPRAWDWCSWPNLTLWTNLILWMTRLSLKCACTFLSTAALCSSLFLLLLHSKLLSSCLYLLSTMPPCSAYADLPISSYLLSAQACQIPPHLRTPSDSTPDSTSPQTSSSTSPRTTAHATPPALHEIYDLEDRNAAVSPCPAAPMIEFDVEAQPQFTLRQHTGVKPPPDYLLPHAEPYSAAVHVMQGWRDEYAKVGDIRPNPFSLVGAMSKFLGPYKDHEGRAPDQYVVSGKLWHANEETGKPYSETGLAVVQGFRDPHHAHLRWFLDHPSCSVDALAHSMIGFNTSEFPASTFPVNLTDYVRPIELNPIPPTRVPHADDLIDSNPLPRPRSTIPDPKYVYLPLVLHPHDASIRILNGFLTHDANHPVARFKKHTVERAHAHEPVPDGWLWLGVVNGVTHYVEPDPDPNQPLDATFPPHSNQYLTFPDNRWTAVPIMSEARAPYARQVYNPCALYHATLTQVFSERVSQQATNHLYVVQVPLRHDPAAHPMSSTEYARRFWIAAQALIPYRYTTPLMLAATYRMEHNLPELPPDTPNHPDFHPACETSSSEDSDSEDMDETSEGSGDDDEKPVPPGPPRSPPPPPAPTVSHATTTASSPPLNHATPGWRNVSTGAPMPPPSPFVAAGYVNTSAGLVRLTPTAWEEKSNSESSNGSESSHEYMPTPLPSLVEPATSHTTRSFTPTWSTPTTTHFRMRALAAHAADRLQTMEHGQEDDTVSFWVGVGTRSSPEVRQPRASVQPPENPLLAPLCPPSPDSARRGIYFYGYCLGEAEENSTTPHVPSSAAPPTENASSSSEGSNSSSSSQESLTSSEDVSPYDSELEYPPTPPPMLLPLSAEPTPRLVLRNPAPKPYLPPVLHHLSAAAQDLMSRPCSPVPRAASPHASALMKSLDEEEVERMLPPRPMSVYRNPAVYSVLIPEAPVNPHIYQPDECAPTLYSINPKDFDHAKPMTSAPLRITIPPSATRASSRAASPASQPRSDDDMDDSDSTDYVPEEMMSDISDEWHSGTSSITSLSSNSVSSARRVQISAEGEFYVHHGRKLGIKRATELIWFKKTAPPFSSFRPDFTPLGRVVYGREKDVPVNASATWSKSERTIVEGIGYVMDASERLLSWCSTRLRKRIWPNNHVSALDHTWDQMSYQVLSALSLDVSSMPTSTSEPQLSMHPPSPTLAPISAHSLRPSASSRSLPDLIDAALETSSISDTALDESALEDAYSFQDAIYREHARRHPLDPVGRVPLPETGFYDPNRYQHGRRASPSTSDTKEPAAKRLKVALPDSSSSSDMVHDPFHDDYTCVLQHTKYLADMRWMRIEVRWLIDRIIAVLEQQGLERKFLDIFLPADKAYTADSIREAFELEFLTNLDGTFRTNSYHHNAILHDAEANFLHTANILFRDLEHWPLAYSIEELLHIKFKHHHDVEQLLRQGHLLNYRNYNSTDPESLESRLEEVDIAFPRSPLTPINEDTFDEDMAQMQEY